MKSEKTERMEGIELLNWESIRTLREKKKYKYFRTSEVDTIKKREMKEKK